MFFSACSKEEDSINDNINESERIGEVDSVQYFGGREKLLIHCWVTESRAKSLHAVWNEGRDSIVVSISEHNNSKPIDILIGSGNGSISEGNHVFLLHLVDKDGNRSKGLKSYVKVYGDKYESSLRNRDIEKAVKSEDNQITITWGRNVFHEIGVEVIYKDISGKSKEIYIPSAELKDPSILKDVDVNGSFKYRTLFNPGAEALDTFHAEYQFFNLYGFIYLDFEDASTTEEFEQGVRNGSLFDIYRGREFYLFKYGNGLLPSVVDNRSSKGEKALFCTIEQNTIGASSRSELKILDPLILNEEIFLGFDMYVDDNLKAGPIGGKGGWIIFSQIWQDARTMPPITLEIKQGSTANLEYQISLKNDDTGPIASESDDWGVRFSRSLARNNWTRFVIHLKASPKGESFFEFYQNGEKVFTSTVDKIAYNLPYDQRLEWRLGLYRSGNVYGTQEVWFDEVKVGRTLEDVL